MLIPQVLGNFDFWIGNFEYKIYFDKRSELFALTIDPVWKTNFPWGSGKDPCFIFWVVIIVYWFRGMRVFYMPIGFHEDILLRAMMRLRVGQGDIVYVITCSPIIGAVKRAIESLKAMCLRQGLIEPNVVELNCRDFYDSIRVLRKIIEKHRDLETYVCSGAGLRILVHLVEIALLTSRKTFNLYYEPEAEGVEPIFIPSQLYLNIYRKPSGLEEEILKINNRKPRYKC